MCMCILFYYYQKERVANELNKKVEYSKVGYFTIFDEYDNDLSELQLKNIKLRHRLSVIKQVCK